MRFYIQILGLAALVLSGISPACAFVSGKISLIEICTADGDIKTIPAEGETPASHHDAKPDCAFCFAQSHFKPVLAAPLLVPVPADISETALIQSRSAHPVRAELSALNPRAPPLPIS